MVGAHSLCTFTIIVLCANLSFPPQQHIYLEDVCKKSFSYPRDDRDDDATQADFPDSSDEDDAVVEIQTVSVIPLPAASATAAVP
jgi:hypothetical protein